MRRKIYFFSAHQPPLGYNTLLKKRRIKEARVLMLSLCKKGKNGMKTLFKSEDTVQTLIKADEKGEVLAVAYPMGVADADGDFVDTMEAIESMAHSFMKEGAQLDIEHNGEVLGREDAYVKESFIVQKGDERFSAWPGYDGEPVDVTGAWAVKLQIDNPELRAAFRDGEWDGVSLFGPAAVEDVELKAASTSGQPATIDMNQEELQSLLAAQEERLTEMVKSLLETPEEVAEEVVEKAEEASSATLPTFTGDVTDPEALAEYEKALRAFELQKAIESGDMTADTLAEMRKSLLEVDSDTPAEEPAPEEEELEKSDLAPEEGDSDEVRELKAKLFKAQKASNAPVAGNVSEEELAKSDKSDLISDLVNRVNTPRSNGGGFNIVQG